MTEKPDTAQEVTELDLEKFIFDVPLYDRKPIKNLRDLEGLFTTGKSRFNGHCYFCGNNSIFYSSVNYNYVDPRDLVGIHRAQFTCARISDHILYMYLHIDEEDDDIFFLQKIGQHPSHADISNAKIKEYTSVLDKTDRSEIVRANGIAAHGVNIGAFVYLRRVFERLVYRHYARSGGKVPKEDFWKLRMNEKIDALKDDLPPFVVKNKNIYGVLSKGLHELSEDECGQYYEILLQSILLILDQEKVQKEKENKEEAIRKALAGLGSGQPT